MTISIQIECACGAKERVEINDEDELPERCRTCQDGEAVPAQAQQAEAPDMWNLTVVPKKRKKPMH